jgi:hypothetical protein
MDYFFMSSFIQNIPHRIVLSYNIVCLWARKEAGDSQSHHVGMFEAFDTSLPEDETKLWTHMVQAWEADPTQPNLFESKLWGKFYF